MGSYKKPDEEVTEFALYYRKYRELKKQGFPMKRGRPRKGQKTTMTEFIHDKAMKILAEQEKEN